MAVRSLVSFTVSSEDGSPIASDGFSRKVSISALMTRPPGPLPRMALRSRACSAAMRRAMGEALTPPGSCAPTMGESGGAASGLDSASGAGAASSGCFTPPVNAATSTLSPGLPITLIGAPTGSTSPSSTKCFNTTPVKADSTSTVALSVSISARTLPRSISPPSATTQRTNTPSAISKPSLGMVTSSAIRAPP